MDHYDPEIERLQDASLRRKFMQEMAADDPEPLTHQQRLFERLREPEPPVFGGRTRQRHLDWE